MRGLRNLLALVGLAAILALGYAAWSFRGFDPKAAAVYRTLAERLAGTGHGFEALVWTRRVDAGLGFAEVDASIRSIARAEGLGEVRMQSFDLDAATTPERAGRRLAVYFPCDSPTMTKLAAQSGAHSGTHSGTHSGAHVAWLACHVSLVEDLDGQLWLHALDMNFVIHGGRPLPETLRTEALGVKRAILAILDGAAEGRS